MNHVKFAPKGCRVTIGRHAVTGKLEGMEAYYGLRPTVIPQAGQGESFIWHDAENAVIGFSEVANNMNFPISEIQRLDYTTRQERSAGEVVLYIKLKGQNAQPILWVHCSSDFRGLVQAFVQQVVLFLEKATLHRAVKVDSIKT